MQTTTNCSIFSSEKKLLKNVILSSMIVLKFLKSTAKLHEKNHFMRLPWNLFIFASLNNLFMLIRIYRRYVPASIRIAIYYLFLGAFLQKLRIRKSRKRIAKLYTEISDFYENEKIKEHIPMNTIWQRNGSKKTVIMFFLMISSLNMTCEP